MPSLQLRCALVRPPCANLRAALGFFRSRDARRGGRRGSPGCSRVGSAGRRFLPPPPGGEAGHGGRGEPAAGAGGGAAARAAIAGGGGGGRRRPRPPSRSPPLPPGLPPSPGISMASRILHRLRHALTGEGERDGLAGCSSEVEEFPESSELEDDTEGLSTRLSGTLSFTSNDEEEEEEEEEDEDIGVAGQGQPPEPELLGEATEDAEHSPPTERRGSNLLTRQLQELWRKSRGSFVPQRLLFEVTSANVVSERNSKYVLYTVYLIRAGQFDKAPACISRRYSDFERLNRHLRRRFCGDMAGVSFPRKRLRRNFAAETIAKRSRAFEQFLAHLHSLPEIRRSDDYLEFFFLRDLQAAQRLTCSGRYPEALAVWANAHQLQERLGACRSGHFLLTLAGLAVCHQELGQAGEAHAACERALCLLEAQDSHPLLAPFLQAHIRLSWVLGRDKRQAEARLQRLQEVGGVEMHPPTLKELLIKQPLP